MKCFIHPANDAVGICKYCAKGACSSCAVDTGQGIACSEACARQVELVAALMSSATAATKLNRRGAAYVMPVFFLFMGLVFIGQAIFTGRSGQSLTFALVLGAGFVLLGVILGAVQYSWHKRSPRADAI